MNKKGNGLWHRVWLNAERCRMVTGHDDAERWVDDVQRRTTVREMMTLPCWDSATLAFLMSFKDDQKLYIGVDPEGVHRNGLWVYLSKLVTVLSLGAGVQSSTLTLQAEAGETERPDCAVFSDTGGEPKKVYQYLEWLLAAVKTFPIYVVRQGSLNVDIRAAAAAKANGQKKRLAQPPAFLLNTDKRKKDGTPQKGQIRRACTYEYKVRALERFVREYAGLKPRQRVPKGVVLVERWYGISMDEVQRMRDSDVSWVVNRYPLIDAGMTRRDCLGWCAAQGLPKPPKSACIMCPYRHDVSWLRMKLDEPEEFAQAVEIDRIIRDGLPGVKHKAFLHASLQPLDTVDFEARIAAMKESTRNKAAMWIDEDDFPDFTGECSGMCGV